MGHYDFKADFLPDDSRPTITTKEIAERIIRLLGDPNQNVRYAVFKLVRTFLRTGEPTSPCLVWCAHLFYSGAPVDNPNSGNDGKNQSDV